MSLSYAYEKLTVAVSYLVGKGDIKSRLIKGYMQEFMHVGGSELEKFDDINDRLQEVKLYFKKDGQESNENNVKLNLDQLDEEKLAEIARELLYILLDINKRLAGSFHERVKTVSK